MLSSRHWRFPGAVFSLILVATSTGAAEPMPRWSVERAQAWQSESGWLVGANYSPAYAINQLEMWQADTFDANAIDRELGWAAGLGFSSMRVFLHHLLWEQDAKGFVERIDQFLKIADRHRIGVMFVLFDSVWDPHPRLGRQRAPQPGLHNSGWVQSPGAADLRDRDRHRLLEAYTRGVVSRFKADRRIHAWDLWNEPDNLNDNSYGRNKLKQEPADKLELTLELLKKSFAWARAADPIQPLTSGLWVGNRIGDPARLIPIERVQLEQSDVISFHSYGKLEEVKRWVSHLRQHNRPLLCTEYMARSAGSTFDPILDYLKEERIGAYNWGFVAGKTNTIYPWDSWQKPYATEPAVWFHDIFRNDGAPFDVREVEHIRQVTGAKKP
jgi:hypothetical protein